MKRRIRFSIMIAMALALGAFLTGCGGSDPELSGIKDTVKVDCGTEFNLDSYLNENLKITDVVDEKTKEYKLKDLEYEITCSDEIYNAETGDVDTSDFGKFNFELIVKDEDGGKATREFTLKLNPLIVEKGFHVNSDGLSDSPFDVMGYCSYTNGSSQFLKIDEVEFQYFDKDGIMVCSNDMPDIAPEYLGEGETGYGYEELATYDAVIEKEDDIVSVEVNIKYSRAKAEDSTTLECSEAKILRDYEGRLGAEFIVTNSSKRKVDCKVVAGMYDADDNLIGTMISMDYPSVAAGGKSKTIAEWLSDSKSIPDKTVKVKGAAYGY